MKADSFRIREAGYTVIEGKVISTSDCVRHDSARLSTIVTELAAKGRENEL